ncbi:hypothetical protein V6N13_068364 [Hibiscus sabdariffa]
MKPQSLSGDHNNSLMAESKGTIREKLKQVCEAAMDVMAKNGVQRGHNRVPISKEIERRSSNHHAEEPIRTMMFLGSWSHT